MILDDFKCENGSKDVILATGRIKLIYFHVLICIFVVFEPIVTKEKSINFETKPIFFT